MNMLKRLIIQFSQNSVDRWHADHGRKFKKPHQKLIRFRYVSVGVKAMLGLLLGGDTAIIRMGRYALGLYLAFVQR